MNMRKVFKQMLATVAAGAMSMAMVMPVFAEDINTKQTEAWISKTYNTEVAKAETFKFNVVQNTEGTGLITTVANVTIPDISFAGDKTDTTTKREKVEFPAYTEAGKYEYTVTENQTATPAVTNGEHEKMIMSEAEYKMDVYVENTTTGGCQIANIIVNKVKNDKGKIETGKVNNIGDTDKNEFKFTNTYVQEAGTGDKPSNQGEDYKTYGSLNVSKTINANGADSASATDSFSFKATFNFPTGTDANTLGGVKANGEAITLTNGAYDFTLKNGGNEKFTGLPVGTTMTVTESATPNYKGSANVTINGADESTVAATKYNEAITVFDKKLGQKKNAVDVTNTYNNVPVTGIIMNNLPYIAMIVIGAAALVVYVQNKRKNLQ